MSRWTEIEASFTLGPSAPKNPRAVIEQDDLPWGSEGGPAIHDMDDGHWFMHGNLRDRGDHDELVEMRNWFVRVVGELHCTKAELELSTYGIEYNFRLEGGEVVLVVPPMYVEAASGNFPSVPA